MRNLMCGLSLDGDKDRARGPVSPDWGQMRRGTKERAARTGRWPQVLCHRLLTAIILVVMVSLLGACGTGSESTSPPPSPPPPPPLTLAQALAATSISRDPTQAPLPQEEAMLQQSADIPLLNLLSNSGTVGAYDNRMNALLSGVGISATFSAYVATDLRLAGIQYGGGVTTHRVLVLDGKFLDMLHEYAVYLALSDIGLVTVSPEIALDGIVPLHNAIFGAVPQGVIYTQAFLALIGVDVSAAAEQYFSTLTATILFHEFGHLFLWHMLDRLRTNAGFFPPNNPFVALAEDDADIVGGMLLKKAGRPSGLLDDCLIIMAYYVEQRTNSAIRLADILAPSFYNTPMANYSSLSGRIQRTANAYAQFP